MEGVEVISEFEFTTRRLVALLVQAGQLTQLLESDEATTEERAILRNRMTENGVELSELTGLLKSLWFDGGRP